MIRATMENEYGVRYEAELADDAEVKLTEGATIPAADLEVNDEVESHYSAEVGGPGHRVVAIH